jgi:hypothetical protein
MNDAARDREIAIAATAIGLCRAHLIGMACGDRTEARHALRQLAAMLASECDETKTQVARCYGAGPVTYATEG